MKVFYDPVQKNHVLTHEIIAGKLLPHHEKKERIEVILKQLRKYLEFSFEIPITVPFEVLSAVHDNDYLGFLKSSEDLQASQMIWPYVFPCDTRLAIKTPVTALTAGHFCFDVGTPIMRDTWSAAVAAASGAYAAAKHVRKTSQIAYALARPPGHHASANKFGGYCYLNNVAIAAHYLSQYGKVLIIDIDYHHGNGTQSIFYDSSKVFYFSLHGDPSNEYPYFTGFADEIGIDDGIGYNLNYPLPTACGAKVYMKKLSQGLDEIFKKFTPEFLIISAGFDIAINDPIGHFKIAEQEFHQIGSLLHQLKLKTIIVQEGGYLINHLGANVRSFLQAFM